MIFGQELYTYRRWFAWRPVRLWNGEWAWLCWVSRWRDGVAGWGFYFYRYEPLTEKQERKSDG